MVDYNPEDNYLLNILKFKEDAQAGQIRWQLDVSDVLDEWEHYLRGYKFDVENKQYIKDPYSEPLLNELGISRVMLLCRQMQHLWRKHRSIRIFF